MTVERRRSTPGLPEGCRQGCLRSLFNPMLVKELRGRMRGARAFAVLTVYLVLLSCFTAAIYYVYKSAATSSGSGVSAMAYMGKVLFASVVLIELFMVTFITPAFTAGAISAEKERKTYEVLRATLLPAHKLVFGKLAAALTYMFLLILAAVPLESLAFVLGGVVLEELVLALILLLATAFFFAALGLFLSSLVRTTLVSTVLSYTVALLVTVGLPVLLLVFTLIGTVAVAALLSTGTSWIGQAVLTYVLIIAVGLSPISAAVGTEVILLEQDTALFYWQSVSSSAGPGSIPVPSPWIIYVVVYTAAALLMLLLAVLQVRRQAKQ